MYLLVLLNFTFLVKLAKPAILYVINAQLQEVGTVCCALLVRSARERFAWHRVLLSFIQLAPIAFVSPSLLIPACDSLCN